MDIYAVSKYHKGKGIKCNSSYPEVMTLIIMFFPLGLFFVSSVQEHATEIDNFKLGPLVIIWDTNKYVGKQMPLNFYFIKLFYIACC